MPQRSLRMRVAIVALFVWAVACVAATAATATTLHAAASVARVASTVRAEPYHSHGDGSTRVVSVPASTKHPTDVAVVVNGRSLHTATCPAVLSPRSTCSVVVPAVRLWAWQGVCVAVAMVVAACVLDQAQWCQRWRCMRGGACKPVRFASCAGCQGRNRGVQPACFVAARSRAVVAPLDQRVRYSDGEPRWRGSAARQTSDRQPSVRACGCVVRNVARVRRQRDGHCTGQGRYTAHG